MAEQLEFEFAERGGVGKRLAAGLGEYVRLYVTFFKLYFQGRMLIARNLALSGRLQMWEVRFFCLRTQVFLTRLVRGFPLADCWPRE